MAALSSNRKKQEERNQKVVRDLSCLLANKHCFDCNQRGPTYVDVTIGSFVCTKCSGLLRGLTPPHRVKSISMAAFTPEEIDLLRSRGNEHCRRTWLGLYEGPLGSEHRNDRSVLDFMVEKYERRRYYLEVPETNGNVHSPATAPTVQRAKEAPKPSHYSLPLRINGTLNNNGAKTKPTEFVADFLSADIYNSSSNGNGTDFASQPNFANFDNNSAPLFSNSNDVSAKPMPTNQQPSAPRYVAPAEDRYAALKDLDNALKSRPALDWSSGSNGSPYSTTPSPASSVYSSPSSQVGSEDRAKGNPFDTSSVWGSNGLTNNGNVGNPFSAAEHAGGMYRGYNWPQNPFKTGSTESTSRSYNPFL